MKNPRMCKYLTGAVLFLLVAASCRQNTATEKEEVSFWRHSFIDSSFQLLTKDHDTTRALHYFDSALKQARHPTVYPKAARFDMKSLYYYFFTNNNEATASMIDSTLAFYNTPELQNQYPRSYVALLLFGGQIAYRLTQYSKANDYFFRAKKLADAHLSPCERTAFNYNIAMVLYRQENYRAALNY